MAVTFSSQAYGSGLKAEQADNTKAVSVTNPPILMMAVNILLSLCPMLALIS